MEEEAVAAVEPPYSLVAPPPTDVPYQNGNIQDVVAAGVVAGRHPSRLTHCSRIAVVEIHALVEAG